MKLFISLQTTSGMVVIFTAHIIYLLKDKDDTIIYLNTGVESTKLTAKYKLEEIVDMITQKAT